MPFRVRGRVQRTAEAFHFDRLSVQLGKYAADAHGSVGEPPHFIGTDLHNPDFMKLAEAYGVVGIRTRPDELGASLREALATEAPVLLEVEVPIMMPPFQVVR